MTRKTRSSAHREAICIAHNWECHLCHQPIVPPQGWALDHIVPLMGGGTDADDNLAPVHNKCHALKTADDVKRIAKGKRVRAKHLGLKETRSRPLPGTKASGWKKKLSGEVVRR